MIDGDTISINGQHVRWNGIDAPEVANPRHPVDDPFGPESRDEMRSIIGEPARLASIRRPFEKRSGGSGKGGFALQEYGTLKLDTGIEAGGTVKPLADWLVEMLDRDIEHLRCEAPFRASVSEAAFIRIAPDGEVFVHNSGMTTNYYLDPLPQTEDEAVAQASDIRRLRDDGCGHRGADAAAPTAGADASRR